MQAACRNIYQIPRQSKGLTQEKAAELIDISVESIRAYESGRAVPSAAAVLRMIEVYEYPVLALQHLKHHNDVAASLLPDVRDGTTLSEAVLELMEAMEDFDAIVKDLRNIAKDNIIDEIERPRYDHALEVLQNAAAAIMAVRFARTKKADSKA